MWGDGRLLKEVTSVTYKVITFSKPGVGVHVHPYPLGMVITINQKRTVKKCNSVSLPSSTTYEFDFLIIKNRKLLNHFLFKLPYSHKKPSAHTWIDH